MAISDYENPWSEPKFVVFLSQLLLLFTICPECKSAKPAIETYCSRTMVEGTTKCFNPHCTKPQNTWKSQQQMTGRKMAARNFLLYFSTLVSGASPSKIPLVFKYMGLACFTVKTYNTHIYYQKYIILIFSIYNTCIHEYIYV